MNTLARATIKMQPVVLRHCGDLASKQRCQSLKILKLSFLSFCGEKFLMTLYICLYCKEALFGQPCSPDGLWRLPDFWLPLSHGRHKGGVHKAGGQYPATFILTEPARSLKNL